MTLVDPYDGVHVMVPREQMTESARKLRDIYAITPGVPVLHEEFGFMEGTLERWREEGMPQNVPMAELFHYDPPGEYALAGLGWCEAEFCPSFDEFVVEDRGEHEVIQDFAGRKKLCFKGRRQGFMPGYIDHPVKDMATWEGDVKWRLNPATPERYANFEQRMVDAKAAAGQGMYMVQRIGGGYMYLRSLIGPTELLMAFYDQPELVHECMRTWFELADAVTAKHQQHMTIEQVFFGEDICYNKGPLISPEMIREFLFPYYKQLLTNVKKRNIDQSRRIFFQLDTDGYAPSVIDIYGEIGMNVMSPFEVASGCDVVEIGKRWPDLVIFGGIDKRVLATDPGAIDIYLERLIPAMRARGGYSPTCDHSVPSEVRYENYLHYRERCVELGG